MPAMAAGEYLPGHTSMIRRDPIGIVGSIAPWNYPLMMMAWKLAPAIAGGNTVVFKPSEQTPLTALKLAKVMADILPEGVINVDPRQRRHRRQCADQPSQDQHDLDHRRRRHRQEGAGGGVEIGQAHASRTRRQGAGDRLSTTPISKRWSTASRRSATTMPGRTARRPAASMRGRRSTTISWPISAAAVSSIRYNQQDDATNEIGPLISQRQRDRVASFVDRAAELPHIKITTGGHTAGRGRLLL